MQTAAYIHDMSHRRLKLPPPPPHPQPPPPPPPTHTHTHTHTQCWGRPTGSMELSNIYKHNDGEFRGPCLRHVHSWDVEKKSPSSINNQNMKKKGQWLSFMQITSACLPFPWTVRAELHKLFYCCVIGTLIFYEYQASPSVSLGYVSPESCTI